MTDRITRWEKWHDPMGAPPRTDFEDEEDEAYEPIRNQFASSRTNMSILMGVKGLIPIGDHNLTSNLYNLHLLHTNFDIRFQEATAMRDVEGVENFRVLTPYRAWVGIGKLFNEQAVKDKVSEAAIYPHGKPKPQLPCNKNIAPFKTKANSFPYWSIYQDSKGNLGIAGGATKDDVEQKLQRVDCVGIIENSWGQKADSVGTGNGGSV